MVGAGLAQHRSQPAQFAVETHRFVAGDDRLEERERRAETPQGYPSLVQGFGLALVKERVFIQTEMPAGTRDGLESSNGRHVAVKVKTFAL